MNNSDDNHDSDKNKQNAHVGTVSRYKPAISKKVTVATDIKKKRKANKDSTNMRYYYMIRKY